ncbi:unnamed protein product [Amoebophrya sp. A120]|nr:unnamed protein product [Amoebophrya sp. A120]|eukprot:GSA120T00022610001.1
MTVSKPEKSAKADGVKKVKKVKKVKTATAEQPAAASTVAAAAPVVAATTTSEGAAVAKKAKKTKKDNKTGVAKPTTPAAEKSEDSTTVDDQNKSAASGAVSSTSTKVASTSAGSSPAEPQTMAAFLLKNRVANAQDFQPVPMDNISDISNKSKKALNEYKSITSLFEIQARVFEHAVAGKDVVGKAKTGCGKTLAFCLPVVERFAKLLESQDGEFTKAVSRKKPLVITLAPTRELAKQIIRDFEVLGNAHNFSSECLYGGVQFGPQCQVLREGRQIIVATPGRLLDHIQRQTIDLSEVRALVLDEADEMLSMGFQEDVDSVINALPRKDVQKLLFSATLPHWVNDLVQKKMTDPQWVDIASKDDNSTNKNISHKCIFCPPQFKADTLGDFVKVHAGALFGKTVIFCDSKKEVNELAQHEKLVQLGAGVLHGDVQQNQREVVMENFRTGKIKVLVATDVAARGLDVPCVDLVINTRPPQDVESYVHRSGRTGRAGNSGVSIIFYSRSDEYMIRILKRKLGIEMQRVGPPQPFDIVKSAAKDSTRFLDSIHQDNVEAFLDQAKQMIEERGAEQALAAAMAGLTGYTKRVQGRSLLSSFQDCTCLKLTSNKPIEATSKGFFLLRQFFDKSLTEDKIKGMTLCADNYSCIFDVPSDQVDAMMAIVQTPGVLWDGIEITIPRELPELQERDGNSWQNDEQAHKDRKKMLWERRTGKGGGGKGGGKGGDHGGKGKGGGKKGGFTGRGGGSAGGKGQRSGPY